MHKLNKILNVYNPKLFKKNILLDGKNIFNINFVKKSYCTVKSKNNSDDSICPVINKLDDPIVNVLNDLQIKLTSNNNITANNSLQTLGNNIKSELINSHMLKIFDLTKSDLTDEKITDDDLLLKNLVLKFIKLMPDKNARFDLLLQIAKGGTNAVNKILSLVTNNELTNYCSKTLDLNTVYEKIGKSYVNNQLIDCALSGAMRNVSGLDGIFDKASEMYLILMKKHIDHFGQNDLFCAFGAFLGSGRIEYLPQIKLVVEKLTKIDNEIKSNQEIIIKLMAYVDHYGEKIKSVHKQKMIESAVNIIAEAYQLKKWPVYVIESAILHEHVDFLVAIKKQNIIPSYKELIDNTCEIDIGWANTVSEGQYQSYINILWP